MAGDWIKIEKATPEKQELVAIAERLSVETDIVFAKLFRLWAWADSNTIDGVVNGVSVEWVDRYTGVAGFGAAMLHVGWLRRTSGGFVFPNYERHMSGSAKKRCQQQGYDSKRKSSSIATPEKNLETSSLLFSSSPGNEGSGEQGDSRAPPRQPGDRPECWLTRVWVFYFAGTQRSERDHESLDRLFADMLRGGMKAEAIEAAIRDPSRPRRQTSWQFESWLKDRPKQKPSVDEEAIRERVRRQRAESEREEQARKAAWEARKARQA